MLSWFKRSKPEEQRGQLADPAEWLFELFGVVSSQSGITVGPATAMTCTASRCAIEALSEAIGQLPLHVYRRSGDARNRATEHPAYRLLHDAFNGWVPAVEGKEQTTRDALLRGDGYLFINRVNGELRELVRLDPGQMAVDVDPTTKEPTYRLTGEDAGERRIPRSDLIHVRAPGSTDGVRGRSPVKDCKEAIALALILERHGATLFARGGTPTGILGTDAKLTTDAINRISKVWKAAFGGRSGGTPVLDNGLKYYQMSLSSVDSQYLELRQFCVNEIARAFRVPPHMLYEMGRATWANTTEMGRHFLTYSLMPWIKRWEQEINLKLFADDPNHYAEFLLDDLVRPDLQARADAYQKLITARVFNANEIRARENMPPYAGGDKYENPNTSSEPAGNS